MEVLDSCIVAGDCVDDFLFCFPQNIRERMQLWHRLTPNFFLGEVNFIIHFNLCDKLLTTHHIFIDLLQGFSLGVGRTSKTFKMLREGAEIEGCSILDKLEDFWNFATSCLKKS